MINPWFKFYGSEYLSDPKIDALTAQERSCWLTMLCMASTSSTPGSIEFLTVETLLTRSGVSWDPYDTKEWDSLLGIIKRFEKMKMITADDEGVITILNWSKRQETNLTDAERSKSYRDRKKNRHTNDTKPVTNVTQEENRIEKNREKEVKKPLSASFNYLKNVPEEDIVVFLDRFETTRTDIKSKAEDLGNWCIANGKRKKNYKLFLLTALKKDFPAKTKSVKKEPIIENGVFVGYKETV